MFATPRDVVRALLTYTDWWQPTTSSMLVVGTARHAARGDGFRPGLLESLGERGELCRRMAELEDRDRRLLFLWYVRQLEVRDIARDLRISQRQCFRRRAAAIRALTDPEPLPDAVEAPAV